MITFDIKLGHQEQEIIVEPWRQALWNISGWAPHAGQTRAFNSYLRHQFNWICAGRRGGKSDFAAEGIASTEFLRKADTVLPPQAYEKYGMRPQRWPKKILLIAPFYKQARIVFGRVYRDVHNKAIPLRVDRFSEQSMEMETEEGAQIMCLTAKNVRGLPGFDWDLIIADELPLFQADPEEIFDEALFPSLLDGSGSFLGIGTPDFPGSYSHGLKLKGMNPKDELWGYEDWTTYDNWFMPHFVQTLDKWRETTPPDIFNRQYMARYVPREGLVYPEAQSCIMNQKEIIAAEQDLFQRGRWYRAIDFGFTNPFVNITVGRLGDTLYAWHEYYKTRTVLEDHAEMLGKIEEVEGFEYELNLCDPEDPGAIRTLANYRRYHPKRGKIRLTGGWAINYTKPKIVDRIDLMRSIMASGHFKIHPGCTQLIGEYGLECYPSRKVLRNYDERPVDANNHGTSAVGYLNDFLFGDVFAGDVEDMLTPGPPAESVQILDGYDP